MLMAFDRFQSDVDLIKQQSTMSSSRSFHQTTSTNFNANNISNHAMQKTHRNTKKTDGEYNFYNPQLNKYKINNLSSNNFYDGNMELSKSRISTSNPLAQKEQMLPSIKNTIDNNTKNGNNNTLGSSQGFQIINPDLKNKMTLDKVLGSGFKTVAIFDANLKEFDNKELFPTKLTDSSKLDENSDSDEQYGFDSFEILESENEEDPNTDVNTKENIKKSRKNATRINVANSEYEDIRDRINKKYKAKHKSNKFRRNAYKLFPSKSTEISTNDQIKAKENTNPAIDDITAPSLTNNIGSRINLETNSMAFDQFKRREYGNKFESKSLSPRPIPDSRRSRLQVTGTYFSEKSKLTSLESNIPYVSKSNFFHGNDTNTPMNLSENTFRNSDEFSTRINEFKAIDKNLDQSRSMISNNNNSKINPNKTQYPDENFNTTNRNSRFRSSFIKLDQSSMTSSKFFNDKSELESYIEQKYIKDNDLTVEKLKLDEKNLLDKYAKKFNFQPNEIYNILKKENKLSQRKY